MLNPSDPAFPGMNEVSQWDESIAAYRDVLLPGGGLTKRELFAAMAMQGILSAPMDDLVAACTADNFLGWVADRSVDAANALIKKLEEKTDV